MGSGVGSGVGNRVNRRRPQALTSWRGHEKLATAQAPAYGDINVPFYGALQVPLQRDGLGAAHVPASLHDLVEAGNGAALDAALESGKFNVNGFDADGLTPLYVAALTARPAMIRLLLADPDIDPNQSVATGDFPLIAATGYKAAPQAPDLQTHLNMVQQLLAHPRINPNPENRTGQTPLAWAIMNGCPPLITLLFEQADLDHRLAFCNRYREDRHVLPQMAMLCRGEHNFASMLIDTLYAAVERGEGLAVRALLDHDLILANSLKSHLPNLLQAAFAATRDEKQDPEDRKDAATLEKSCNRWLALRAIAEAAGARYLDGFMESDWDEPMQRAILACQPASRVQAIASILFSTVSSCNVGPDSVPTLKSLLQRPEIQSMGNAIREHLRLLDGDGIDDQGNGSFCLLGDARTTRYQVPHVTRVLLDALFGENWSGV